MQVAIEKANILMEALPYIRKFSEKTFVIKFGGNAMVSPALSRNFALDVILLSYVGIRPVVVHGGGPQIGLMLKRLGIESHFFEGERITPDRDTMDIVEMVLGKINKDLVSSINTNGGKAVGLSGKDGNLIIARKQQGKTVDMGFVGEITTVNPKIITTLDGNQFIPVIAPIGIGSDGQAYNINADTAAGAIAGALKAEKLILLTDVEGVKDRRGNLLSSLTDQEAQRMIDCGDISGGMIPKVTCCIRALEQNVVKTHIIDGRVEHAVLLEIFTDVGIGTQIVRQ
ncbi:MAG: acetylglutamate kinase [Desulfobacterota bacterium]|nr:acetylglutamate kinase [Thermodesulfobacteriota bacterium]